jgi:hypothetical protein
MSNVAVGQVISAVRRGSSKRLYGRVIRLCTDKTIGEVIPVVNLTTPEPPYSLLTHEDGAQRVYNQVDFFLTWRLEQDAPEAADAAEEMRQDTWLQPPM